jgi:hypothetical protein
MKSGDKIQSLQVKPRAPLPPGGSLFSKTRPLDPHTGIKSPGPHCKSLPLEPQHFNHEKTTHLRANSQVGPSWYGGQSNQQLPCNQPLAACALIVNQSTHHVLLPPQAAASPPFSPTPWPTRAASRRTATGSPRGCSPPWASTLRS